MNDAQLTLDFERAAEMEALPAGLRILAETIRKHSYDRPVPGSHLAKVLGSDLRGIAAQVRALVIIHRLPIGSIRTGKGGYYWIRTHEELEAACNLYHETALELLRRESALKKISLHELLGQLQFELGTCAAARS